MRNKKTYKVSEWAFVAAAIVLYLFIACAHSRKPGLHYDEVFYANVALGCIDPWTFIEDTIKIKGKIFPTMTMSYIGALEAYLHIPFFKFLGATPLGARLAPILLGAVTLLFTYLFLKIAFNKKVASLALLLTAIDPTFIFQIRVEMGPVAMMMVLKMASLYFLARWVQTRQTRYLALGGFLNGLGLYDKANFIWYLVGMGLAVLLVFRKEIFQRVTLKMAAVFVLFFVLGSLPLIYYNVRHHFNTFRYQSFLSKETLGHVPYKIECLEETLNGTNLYLRVNDEKLKFGFLSRENTLLKGNLLPVLLLISAPIVLFQKRERWIKVILVGMVAILAQTFVILNAGSAHHIMIAYPFPQIIIAWLIIHVLEWLRARFRPEIARPMAVLACVVFLAPPILADLCMDFLYVKSFVKIGGRGVWSDAIYDLAAFAKTHADRKFVLLEWGLENQLLLLSEGTIKREEIFWSLVGDRYQARLSELVRDPSNIYVSFAPQHRTLPEVARFEETIKSLGLEGKVYKTFYQRDGQPVYVLYEVTKPNALSSLVTK